MYTRLENRFDILEVVRRLCEKACPEYTFAFEDRSAMNVKADNIPFPSVYFEEYRRGWYTLPYFNQKTTVAELYFCKSGPMHDDGFNREKLRLEIEAEAVKPFLKLLRDTDWLQRNGIYFSEIKKVDFFTPPPRFDANEVSIMLQFELTLLSC